MTRDERQFWFWQMAGIVLVAANLAAWGWLLWMLLFEYEP
jgi:hypothetical protein